MLVNLLVIKITTKNLLKRDKELVAELDRNETIRQKSLYYAADSYCHKK